MTIGVVVADAVIVEMLVTIVPGTLTVVVRVSVPKLVVNLEVIVVVPRFTVA